MYMHLNIDHRITVANTNPKVDNLQGTNVVFVCCYYPDRNHLVITFKKNLQTKQHLTLESITETFKTLS